MCCVMIICVFFPLRDGCEVLCDSLNKHNVPLLIFSAGLADILRELLRQQNLLLPNMRIIANVMKFDENVSSFQLLLIHILTP